MQTIEMYTARSGGRIGMLRRSALHLVIGLTVLSACGGESEHTRRLKAALGIESAVDENFAGFSVRNFLQQEIVGAPVSVVSLEQVSSGTTKGKPAAVFRVRYTSHHPGLVIKQCSHIHVAYNKEWRLYENIICSIGSERCSPDDGCFACADFSFRDRIQHLGFSGSTSFLTDMD